MRGTTAFIRIHIVKSEAAYHADIFCEGIPGVSDSWPGHTFRLDEDLEDFLAAEGSINAALQQGLNSKIPVQVAIQATPEELATVNWETLAHPTLAGGRPVATVPHVVLYREVSVGHQFEAIPYELEEKTQELRVLVVLTFPKTVLLTRGAEWTRELPGLKLQSMTKKLDMLFKRLGVAAQFLTDTDEKPVCLRGDRRFGIKERLEEGRFSALHIITHGELLGARSAAHLGILHEPKFDPNNDDPSRVAVNEQALREVFTQLDAASKPHLVVLQACLSGVWGNQSLAAALSSAGIPAVIAMQGRLGDEQAFLYSQAFYGYLRSMSVETALAHTRRDLYEPSILDSHPKLWHIPILFKHRRSLVSFGVVHRDRHWENLEETWRTSEEELRQNTPPFPGKYIGSQKAERLEQRQRDGPLLAVSDSLHAGAVLEECLDLFQTTESSVVGFSGASGCGRTRALKELMIQQIGGVRRAKSTSLAQGMLPMLIEAHKTVNQAPTSARKLLQMGFVQTYPETWRKLDGSPELDDWIDSDHFLVLVDDADLWNEGVLRRLIDELRSTRHSLVFAWRDRLPRAIQRIVDVQIELGAFAWKNAPKEWGIHNTLESDAELRKFAQWPSVAAAFEEVWERPKTELLRAWVEDELDRTLRRRGIREHEQTEVKAKAHRQLEHVGNCITKECRGSVRTSIRRDLLFRDEPDLDPERDGVNHQAWEVLLSSGRLIRESGQRAAICDRIVTQYASARWAGQRISETVEVFSQLAVEYDYIMADDQARIQQFLASELSSVPAKSYLLIQFALGSGKRKVAINTAFAAAEALQKKGLSRPQDSPYSDRTQRMALMLLVEDLTERPLNVDCLHWVRQLANLEDLQRLGSRLHLTIRDLGELGNIASGLKDDSVVLGAIPLLLRWATSGQAVSWLLEELHHRQLSYGILNTATREILEVPEHFELLQLCLLSRLSCLTELEGPDSWPELDSAVSCERWLPNRLSIYEVLDFLGRPDLVGRLLERLPLEQRELVMREIDRHHEYPNARQIIRGWREKHMTAE